MSQTADQQVRAARPAEDIAEDIAALIRAYHPLRQSRHFFSYSVAEDGVVTLRGHVKSAIAERVLLDNVPHILGVTGIDAELYNDEALRLAVAGMLPAGARAMVDYGRVILTGTLPARNKPEALVKKLEALPGVTRVLNQLS